MLGKFMDSCIQGCTVTQWPMLANVSLPDFQRPLSSAMLDQPLIQPRSIRQLGFAEGRNLSVPQRKQVAALGGGIALVGADGSWFDA